MAYYIDTSALTKLVVSEPETGALRAWLGEAARRPVACDLARTELLRTVRAREPSRMLAARATLDAVTLTSVTAEIYESAARLDPSSLRSLDAIHLAAALDLGDDLDGIVTYDSRLAEAAVLNGVPVIGPR